MLNLERFEQENHTEKGSLSDFGAWLVGKQSESLVSKNEMVDTSSLLVPAELRAAADHPEVIIGKLLTFLSRYLKIYFKKGLEDSVLTTGDDFTYLATLLHKGSLTKTELIMLNAHEKTSGMEVIKRLLNNDLIEQSDDESDKRSKRISLTSKGKSVLIQSFDMMGKVGKICTGDLTDAEKNQLMNLLKKLDNFHHDIYLNHRDFELERIIAEKIS